MVAGKRFEAQPKKIWTYDTFVSLPNNKFRKIWEILIGFMIVYTLLVAPYR